MSRVYLLVHNDSAGSREQIRDALNGMSLIKTWRYDMPHCFYIVSESSADEISDAIREKLGRRGRFIISEINENRQGWLPKETWYFIREKRPKPKEPHS